MNIIGVIPSRYGSTRLPAKPLANINGKPLVWHVVQQAKKAKLFSRIIVATDDKRIVDALAAYDIDVMLTSAKHASGTERVAEVARKTDAALYINIQGDEPMIPPANIKRCVELLTKNKSAALSTVAVPLTDAHDIADPNVVKVVTDANNRALFFSRSPIPFQRDAADKPPRYFKHLGIYGYRRSALLSIVKLKPAPIERAEKLEQLRWLYNGYDIYVARGAGDSVGVDTPADLERVRMLLRK